MIRGRACILLVRVTMPPKSQQRSLTSFFAPKSNPTTTTKKAVQDSTGSVMSSSVGAKRGVHDMSAEAADGDGAKKSKVTVPSPLQEQGWATALAPEISKPYFKRLQTFLDAEYASKTIFPPREQIFSAFESCPFGDVKVVILGQDPYHGPGQAHGLAFSVMKGVPQPPSLRNMIKEAVNCCGIKPTRGGNLDAWCRQGVLLINSVLSVEKSKANSHQKKGWEQFTDAVIRELNKGDRRLVFMLWGKPSQKKGGFIDSTKHKVLMCAHPSPLSASRGPDPFIGSACFAKANEALTELGHGTVDWNVEA